MTDERTLRIRLFARVATGRPAATAALEETWSSYVDHYMRPDPTAAELQPKQAVFLKRYGGTRAWMRAEGSGRGSGRRGQGVDEGGGVRA